MATGVTARPASRSGIRPAWVDLGSTDPDLASTFYADVLGWTVTPVDDPDAGGYRLCRRDDGKLVAGLGALTPGLQDRSWWDVHVGVADVEAAARRVEDAGGRLLAGPIDILGLGRLAVCADPLGGQVRLLEGLAAEAFGEAGAVCWVDRVTTDADRARDFARDAFGWDVDVRPPLRDDEQAADWVPYFGAVDVDAAVADATARGGVVVGRHPVPAGPAVVLRDPTGAVFGIVPAGA